MVVIVILLIVCVLGLGGFIVYDKVLKKEPEKQTEKEKNNINESTKEEDIIVNIGDKDSLLLKIT